MVNEKRVYLDPKKTDSTGINFVSHAHTDHLPSKNGGTILSSLETNKIANLRGFKMENYVETLDDFSLIDSGFPTRLLLLINTTFFPCKSIP